MVPCGHCVPSTIYAWAVAALRTERRCDTLEQSKVARFEAIVSRGMQRGGFALTRILPVCRRAVAYAVSRGGVAEWLKAAVC